MYQVIDKGLTYTGFKSLSTTIVLVILYFIAFASVFLNDEPPEVPRRQKGLDLKEAYGDLHNIAARPHPYNSHANDVVRAYILSRLRNIADDYDNVQIANDRISNSTWVSEPYGPHVLSRHAIYFEGNNLLVKIEGSDKRYQDHGGVLLSAHFDSVSTAPGATDDGMGVATLIQLVEYFAKNQPKRTVVFNINNGEEDGLHGAYAFLKHPWSRIPDTFLNLEGASSGGRPMLFRASSTAPVLSFSNDLVKHPHANVLSSDAFSRGVIRSGTDYTVYTNDGMQGLDVAFYEGRSKYHTKYDTIPHTDGLQRSLWAMMETARGSSVSLANEDQTHDSTKWGGRPVYFDLFGKALIVFSLTSLLTFNIFFLVLGPIFIILFSALEFVVRQSRRQTHNGEVHPNYGVHSFQHTWEQITEFNWLRGAWNWAKFWVALLLTGGAQVALVAIYLKANPFIMYSQPYLVFISSLTLTYLTLVLPIQSQLPIKKSRHNYASPDDQKHTVLRQTYFITWIFLLISTVAVGQAKIGGFYFITVWNVLVFSACIVSCIEGIFTPPDSGRPGAGKRRAGVRFQRRRSDSSSSSSSSSSSDSDNGRNHAGSSRAPPTEQTPLVGHNGGAADGQGKKGEGEEEGSDTAWWALQMVLLIPVPTILVLHVAALLLAAMPQTLADGTSALSVYTATSLLAFLTTLPIAPFAIKMHRSLTLSIAFVFVVTTLYAWFAFPFSQEAPLKVFFQQRLDLAPDNHLSTYNSSISSLQSMVPIRATTSITGVHDYLQRSIIPSLPSSHGKDVICKADKLKVGLTRCSWDTKLYPVPTIAQGKPPGAPRPIHWLEGAVVRVGPAAEITLKGVNTRSCRVYFENRKVTKYEVEGGGEWQSEEAEVDEIRLWSRVWGKQFDVRVGWNALSGRKGRLEGGDSQVGVVDDDDERLKGRVACEWNEYESGAIGMGQQGGRIPAFEEVISFLPKWAVVSKQTDGLVEAWVDFEV